MSAPDTVDAFLARTAEAWNAGDSVAYGGEFTEDATYVIFPGDVLLGRAAIIAGHEEVFTRWQKGTRMVVRTLRTHLLADNLVAVLTIGGVGKQDRVPFDKFQTYTLVRRPGGRWQCAAFQNTFMSERSQAHYNQSGE
ncbi:SgcJ/EcaC family oxidoreductase [Amycolatopsis silviterrae]|uniref:SgcJ/EcaC family oxidoreductase n=1 Tax=Amycolatopsis silviterrae TaxID=1656914 RepID=A0ABW5H680_9PSEU